MHSSLDFELVALVCLAVVLLFAIVFVFVTWRRLGGNGVRNEPGSIIMLFFFYLCRHAGLMQSTGRYTCYE